MNKKRSLPRKIVIFILHECNLKRPYFIIASLLLVIILIVSFFKPEKIEVGKISIDFFIGAISFYLGMYFTSINKKRTKYWTEIKYADDLKIDIKIEQLGIEKSKDFRNKKNKIATELIPLLVSGTFKGCEELIYYNMRYTSRRAIHYAVNKSIDQLHKTGNLDIFKYKEITNLIIDHQLLNLKIDQLELVEEQILFDIRKTSSKILSANLLEETVLDCEVVLLPKGRAFLLNTDRGVLNDLAVQIHYANSANNRLLKYLDELDEICNNLSVNLALHYKLPYN